jgi:ferredoxin-type protein NapG
MSNDRQSRKSTPQRGLSRRDFVLGRFIRAIPLEEQQRKTWRPLVMRYPKTLSDVAGDDPETAREASVRSAPVPSPAARRRTIPVLRPPGAIDEESFLRGCTRCELCIEACPHDAIVHAPAQMREAAGTPMIQVDHQPCLMCADFPCIAACEPSVLTHLVPLSMGTAQVTQHLCLAHHGTTCTVCSERCPVEGAIAVNQGKPTINESVCTGCGVCRYVCPAPENAILHMPTFIRPTPCPTSKS